MANVDSAVQIGAGKVLDALGVDPNNAARIGLNEALAPANPLPMQVNVGGLPGMQAAFDAGRNISAAPPPGPGVAASPAPVRALDPAMQARFQAIGPTIAPPPQAQVIPPAPLPTGRTGGGGGGVPGVAGPADLSRQIVAAGEAEKAGVEKLQEAKATGAEAAGQATEGLAVEQRAQAQELADKQVQTRQLQATLDQQDAENLKKAKDYTIPEFWKGSEGAKVGSILSIAMGGIASGILGGPNGALTIVNKNVDDYFTRQKEKVDNLYKYAEQTGRLNDKTRLRYAQELTDLQAQHNAINQSILTRISAVEKNNTANVDRAATDSLKAGITEKVLKGQEEERANRASIANQTLTARANAAQSYAAAAASKATAAAAKAGGGKADDSLVYDANGRPFTNAQTPAAAQKFRDQQAALADLGKTIGELEQSYKKGAVIPGGFTAGSAERNAITSRMVLAAKTVGQLGALSGPDMQLVENLAGGNVGQILGRPEGIQNLKRLHETGINTALSQIGAPPTPENRQRFAAPGTPQGGAGGQHPIGTRATSGGKPIVMTANGWQFAQ